MLDYERIDISEGIDPTKTHKSKECMICQYWFFNHGFKFQDSTWNGCHDLTMLCLNINDIAFTIVKIDYCCLIHNISKSEPINLLESVVLEKRGYTYKIYCLKFQSIQDSCFNFFLFTICKMQGRSEGTSSVTFETLIIKSEIDFINLFIFNCLTSNINLFIFNCLTSNINLFNFSYLTSNFIFRRTNFLQAEENGCLWTRVLSFGFSTQPGK